MIDIDGVKFYTTEEAANKLSISTQTVRKYFREGKLRAQKIGRNFVVSEKNLAKFLNAD